MPGGGARARRARSAWLGRIDGTQPINLGDAWVGDQAEAIETQTPDGHTVVVLASATITGSTLAVLTDRGLERLTNETGGYDAASYGTLEGAGVKDLNGDGRADLEVMAMPCFWADYPLDGC